MPLTSPTVFGGRFLRFKSGSAPLRHLPGGASAIRSQLAYWVGF
jgi:hypothetical protein